MTALRVHAVLSRSSANGPGNRAVVWTQGCSLGCPGCFNPETHQGLGGTLEDPQRLAKLLATPDVDGLTVSGGEPLEQFEPVIELLTAFRRHHSGTTILLTGYSPESLTHRLTPGSLASLRSNLDVLIAGPYRAGKHLASGLRGSSNKEVLLVSDRYTREEIDATPLAEVIIGPDGAITMTGVSPVQIGKR